MSKKISVIVSSHNREKLIKRSLMSIVNQSFKDFELIVVDDASTDGSVKVINRVISENPSVDIKLIQLDNNSGTDSKPKNTGIMASTGEYICFMDDDDKYRPDALKIFIKYAEQSGADVVYCDYLMQDDKGKMNPGWSLQFSASNLSRFNFITPITAIIKADKLKAVGGLDEDIPKFKDWNMWIRLHKSGASFMHVPIITSEVYPQKGSISETVEVKYDENGQYLPTFFSPTDCKIYPDNTSLGKKDDLKVAVFTLTKDRIYYTKIMAENIKKTAGYEYDWFVIDDGSTDETVEWIKSNTDIKAYQLHEKSLGIATAWNDAVELIKKTGKYDIIVKIDNDSEMLTSGWLSDIVYISERNKKFVLSPYVEGLEDSPGGVLRQRPDGQSPYILIGDKVLGIVPYVGGICWACSADLYNDFKFDPDQRGNKDYFISQYAKSIGYSCFYMEEQRILHQEGTTGQKLRYPEKELDKNLS